MQLEKCRDIKDINGQLFKFLCRCQKRFLKNLKKRKEKNLSNSVKLDLPSCPFIPLIFIKRYARSIFWCFVQNWAIPDLLCGQTFWRFTEDVYKILRFKIWRKKLPISLKYVQESFSFTPYIFIKRYTWSNNFEKIHKKLSIS